MADINLGVGAANSATGGYEIANSVKLESDNTEFFIKNTMSSTGNRRTWTFSGWVKRSELCGTSSAQAIYATNVDGNEGTIIRFSTENTSYYDAIQIDIGAGGTNSRSYTKALYRDTTAWYHIVLACDTTQSTDTDRFKLYVNGVLVTEYASRNNPAQNFDTSNNLSGAYQQLGAYETGGGQYAKFNGYMAECYNIDGQALAPTDFGEFDNNGIWIAKEYTGTFGTNGFYLNFSNAASMGADSSGQGNSLPPQNINQNDQTIDVPTNNFCTGNALVNASPGSQTLTQGGAKFANPASQNWQTITGTFGLSAGKWYWEFESDGTGAFVGIADVEDDVIPDNLNGYFLGYGDNDSATTNSLGMYSANGVIYNDNSGATGNSYGSGNRVGVALDMDNEKIYFAVDNNWTNSSDPAAGTNGATWNSSWSDTVFPAGSCAQNNSIFFGYGGFSGLGAGNTNLTNTDENGYGAFKYAPPSGYYAICTKNLAEYG